MAGAARPWIVRPIAHRLQDGEAGIPDAICEMAAGREGAATERQEQRHAGGSPSKSELSREDAGQQQGADQDVVGIVQGHIHLHQGHGISAQVPDGGASNMNIR